MAGYESEHTRFMREWMQKHPEEEREQAQGRALWWDKAPLSPDEAKRLKAARAPATAYYYDPYSSLGT